MKMWHIAHWFLPAISFYWYSMRDLILMCSKMTCSQVKPTCRYIFCAAVGILYSGWMREAMAQQSSTYYRIYVLQKQKKKNPVSPSLSLSRALSIFRDSIKKLTFRMSFSRYKCIIFFTVFNAISYLIRCEAQDWHIIISKEQRHFSRIRCAPMR